MIKLLISGCRGQMGRTISAMIAERTDMQVVAGVDALGGAPADYPVYDSFDGIAEKADLVIDFSHISLTPALLGFCTQQKIPLILCTTGIAGDLQASVVKASEVIPIFKSGNMSLGVSLLQALVRQATRVLGDRYDIEIIEKHHNKKVDAPSGTALMIAQAAADALGYEPVYVYDRTKEHKRRDSKEIGIQSVRGGNIVGEHEIMFIGADETLTISHSAQSRALFASGAIKAVEYMIQKDKPGLYDMDDLVSSLA